MKVAVSSHTIDVIALNRVLQRYSGRTAVDIVMDFESQFATAAGVPSALATASGTAALHLALMAAGVERGDLVLVPDFAYVAVVNPVLYVGGEPVFIDCALGDWNMDVELLERALEQLTPSRKVKAIIVAHNFGVPADMPRIMALATHYGVTVIEDAAESLGASIRSRWCGTFGHFGVYSFNANKTVTAFGGGMLVAQDAEKLALGRLLSRQARQEMPFYQFDRVGYNYSLSPLQAAYGLSQFEQLSNLNQQREQAWTSYARRWKGLVTPQIFASFVNSSYWIPAFYVDDTGVSEKLGDLFGKYNVEVRRLWNPLSKQEHLKQYLNYSSGIGEFLFQRGLCFPVSFPAEFPTDAFLNDVTNLLTKKHA